MSTVMSPAPWLRNERLRSAPDGSAAASSLRFVATTVVGTPGAVVGRGVPVAASVGGSSVGSAVGGGSAEAEAGAEADGPGLADPAADGDAAPDGLDWATGLGLAPLSPPRLSSSASAP